MPVLHQHLARAEKNERFYQTISSSRPLSEQFPEWEVVVLFYSALHYVDAFLATLNLHPQDHGVRNWWTATSVEIRPIYFHYQNLYRLSRRARYDLIPFSRPYVQNLYTRDFQPIKQHLHALLGLP